MQLVTKVVPRDFNLFLAGDEHEGTLSQHTKGINKMLSMLLKPYAKVTENRLVHHGDPIEAITLDDKRYDPTLNDKSVLDQIKAIQDRYLPYNDLIITILSGNHDLKLSNVGNINKVICNKIGVIPGTYTAIITYVDPKGKVLFKHFATHGRKSISSTADDPVRRKTNLNLILKRLLKNKCGDCILQSRGHSHLLTVCEPDRSMYLTATKSEIKSMYIIPPGFTGDYIHPDLRWYVSAGSFYRAYPVLGQTSYVEFFDYDPIECGFAIAQVRDGEIKQIDKIFV